ncbi:MAG: YicC/YloC family endoribonuclease [bacterium]
MIKSMTGFGRAEKNSDIGTFICELRSLNHRYLDLSIRLPEEVRFMEPIFRKTLSQQVSRGKVELCFRYNKDNAAQSQQWLVDPQQLASVQSVSEQLQQAFPDAQALSIQDLSKWPGLLSQPGVDKSELQKQVELVLNEALEQLISARSNEGEHTAQLITDRLSQIEVLTNQAQKLMPEVVAGLRERLFEKAKELAEIIDEQRMEQELAVLLQKMDVDEELDRLTGHIAAMRKTIESKGPKGRKLDFLTQELHREANTLGSKSINAETSSISVELKVLIEQIREQVQNIE